MQILEGCPCVKSLLKGFIVSLGSGELVVPHAGLEVLGRSADSGDRVQYCRGDVLELLACSIFPLRLHCCVDKVNYFAV